MSNALCWPFVSAMSQPKSASAPVSPLEVGPVESVVLGLLAIGLCLLIAWIVRRILRPGKLSLSNSPGRPNLLNPGHIVGVLLLMWGAAALAEVTLGPLMGEDSPQYEILRSLSVQVVWLAAALVMGAIAFVHGLRRGMGLTARRWILDSLRGGWAFLAVLPVCLGLMLASKSVLEHYGIQSIEHESLELAWQVSTPWLVLLGLSVVVLAPLTEEIFFRGLVQSMLRRYLHRPWVAVVLTAVFFAALHEPYWYSMPPLLALGLAIGYNYERTGRLWAPILIHALFNALNLGLKIAEQP